MINCFTYLVVLSISLARKVRGISLGNAIVALVLTQGLPVSLTPNIAQLGFWTLLAKVTPSVKKPTSLVTIGVIPKQNVRIYIVTYSYLGLRTVVGQFYSVLPKKNCYDY